jgi:thiamine pyrophosphate-dependent acetolactate synthase large subunit-like protein
MKITAASLLSKYLEAEDVEYIFGVPGTSSVPLHDATNKQSWAMAASPGTASRRQPQ